MDMHEPDPLPVTVPLALHDAMVEAFDKIERESEIAAAVDGQDFAVSYLCGAMVVGSTLRPRGKIAHERLSDNPVAMNVIAGQMLTLGKPLSSRERMPIKPIDDLVLRYRRTGKFS